MGLRSVAVAVAAARRRVYWSTRETFVQVTGFVNAEPDFIGHGKVVDGCSNMLVKVLGDRGKHARSCVGTGSLPAAVSMEMSVRVRD